MRDPQKQLHTDAEDPGPRVLFMCLRAVCTTCEGPEMRHLQEEKGGEASTSVKSIGLDLAEQGAMRMK